jgi:hypothetical protein
MILRYARAMFWREEKISNSEIHVITFFTRFSLLCRKEGCKIFTTLMRIGFRKNYNSSMRAAIPEMQENSTNFPVIFLIIGQYVNNIFIAYNNYNNVY